jgi:hypothetical protein
MTISGATGFFEAGHLASYHCQYRALKLKPWEFPPVWMDNVTATLKEPHNRIGDVLEQGSLPAALDSYKASLAIADRLAKADPGKMPAGSATSPSQRTKLRQEW